MMKKSGTYNTAPPVYNPLEDGPVIAPRSNRYNEISNLVLAERRPQHELTMPDQGVMSAALNSAGSMIASRQQTHHARSDDSALTIAVASIVASAPSWAFSALTTGALLLVGWWTLGKRTDGDLWLMAWLVIEGVIALYFFYHNREQTLHHSPSGIAHHEIESREAVALHAIDRHADIIERKLGLNQVVDIPPSRRLTA